MIALDPEQRRGLVRMGPKSEAFCRQTINVLAQNPQVIPPSLSLAEARSDLSALETLRPRLTRLQQLTERAQDTDEALGSDLMSFALEGYALLKVSGRNQGLEGLRSELSSRFAKSRSKGETTPPSVDDYPAAPGGGIFNPTTAPAAHAAEAVFLGGRWR